jgi:hypothetical protein
MELVAFEVELEVVETEAARLNSLRIHHFGASLLPVRGVGVLARRRRGASSMPQVYPDGRRNRSHPGGFVQGNHRRSGQRGSRLSDRRGSTGRNPPDTMGARIHGSRRAPIPVGPASGTSQWDQEETPVKMLMQIKMPNEDFNDAVREGEAARMIDRILEAANPEAVYFTELDGQRAAMMIVNVDDPSQLPSYAEPWYLEFDAEVEFKIAMTPDDLKRSRLDKIGKKWG